MPNSTLKSKRSHCSTKEKDAPNNNIMQLELTALREKNFDLTKMNTRLLQQVVDLKNKLCSLQAENLQIYQENKNLSTIMAKVSQTTRSCLPNLLEFLNAVLHVTENSQTCQSGKVKNMSGVATPNRTVTHTVKPHTVNGTVLNLMPIISLTRLHNSAPATSSLSAHNPNLDKTALEDKGEMNIGEHLSVNNPEEETSFVTMTRRTKSASADLNKNEPVDLDDENGDEAINYSFMEERMVSGGGLTPIVEESQTLERSASNVEGNSNGEIPAHFPLIRDSSSSTDTQVNELSFSLDATVTNSIPDPQTLKSLRVFSPRSNSTRIDFDESLILDCRAATPIYPPSKSFRAEVSDAVIISRIPTPPASAMGDMTRSVYSNRRDSEDNVGISDASPVSSVSKSRYSCGRQQSRSLDCSVNIDKLGRDWRKRDNSQTPLSPIIMLKKLGTNLEMDRPCSDHSTVKRSSSWNENEKKSVKRKRMALSRNRTPSDENEHKNFSEENVQEVGRRLSWTSSSSSSRSRTTSYRKGPARAAKPKELKDSSLKKKLRRS
ncbi:uncharacterized protein LOC132699015 isoform X2 [Cylas formicarius]|uniref:uncharacterized protein LOC132699015 isoform X2 n=1 Tax=Cylas formicarius TaxID=197179 RepID=UPI002958DF45|nr:uncharacterized protein LOC132699015 isoform X2 [Cylas formicarius]